jgi:hypothetical protein
MGSFLGLQYVERLYFDTTEIGAGANYDSLFCDELLELPRF